MSNPVLDSLKFKKRLELQGKGSEILDNTTWKQLSCSERCEHDIALEFPSQ